MLAVAHTSTRAFMDPPKGKTEYDVTLFFDSRGLTQRRAAALRSSSLNSAARMHCHLIPRRPKISAGPYVSRLEGPVLQTRGRERSATTVRCRDCALPTSELRAAQRARSRTLATRRARTAGPWINVGEWERRFAGLSARPA